LKKVKGNQKDNIMGKKTKGQTTIYKALHRKLKSESQEPR